MLHKYLLSAATLTALILASTSALADVPMPECVNNPACNQGGGCTVSSLPSDAGAAAGAIALAGAVALLARRRRALVANQ